jgi:23S rRNA pseudouridine1911/1915/1917 synthase
MESTILFEDEHIIVYNKCATIMVQPDRSEDPDLLSVAEAHCGKKLFVIHRIDRPVSGVVVYAKNKTAAHALSAQFKARTVEKTYLTAVSGPLPAPEGVLIHYLEKMPQKNRSHVHNTPQKGTVQCELGYKLIGSTDHYQLLQVQLITGKHHQIRAQLSAIGCPIKGDVKYGARRKNQDRSIHLHAWKLALTHPETGEKVVFEAPVPQEDNLWKAVAGITSSTP